MNCPEHLVLDKGPLMIWMYYADVPRHTIPWTVWANPLRYDIIFRWKRTVWHINPNGRWAVKASNAIYRLKVRLGLRPAL
jgi:hypothetical protein